MSRGLLPRAFWYSGAAQAYLEWAATREEPARVLRLRGSLGHLGAALDVARAACAAWLAFERIGPGSILGENAWFESAGVKSARLPVTRPAADAAGDGEFLDFLGAGQHGRGDPLDELANAEITVATADGRLAAVLLALGASLRCEDAEWTAQDLLAWFEKRHAEREPDIGWLDPGPLREVVEMNAPAVGSAEALTRWMSEVDLSSRDAQRLLGEAFADLVLVDGDDDAARDLVRGALLRRLCEGRLTMEPEAAHWLFFNTDNEFLSHLQDDAKKASEEAHAAFLDWVLTEDALIEMLGGSRDSEKWWYALDIDRATLLERGADALVEAEPLRALELAAEGQLPVDDAVQFATGVARSIDWSLDVQRRDQLEYFDRVAVAAHLKAVLGTRSGTRVYEVLRDAVSDPDRLISFDEDPEEA